ncbi:MAG: hypothetical protein JW702_05555 [Clostridiales bacterium]|nr:hypothetical protein [Clostridiales bacterium]
MPSKKLIIVLLIAIMGFGNIIVGAWSFITLDSLDVPSKISTLTSQLESFDTSLIKTAGLEEPISNLKQSALEQLNLFENYSEMLNTIPIYFLITGALFLTISLITYIIIPDTGKAEEK